MLWCSLTNTTVDLVASLCVNTSLPVCMVTCIHMEGFHVIAMLVQDLQNYCVARSPTC